MCSYKAFCVSRINTCPIALLSYFGRCEGNAGIHRCRVLSLCVWVGSCLFFVDEAGIEIAFQL